MSDFISIANIDELRPGECKVVSLDERTFALYNVDGAFYLTDNHCLHNHGPLGDGELNGEIITCPWHGWKFNVCNGENVINPDVKLNTYEIQLSHDEVLVKI